MKLTDKQKQELDIAASRVAAGTASALDKQNLEFAAKTYGYNYQDKPADSLNNTLPPDGTGAPESAANPNPSPTPTSAEQVLPEGSVDSMTALKLALREASNIAIKSGVTTGTKTLLGGMSDLGYSPEKVSGDLVSRIADFVGGQTINPIKSEFASISDSIDSISTRNKELKAEAKDQMDTMIKQGSWNKLTSDQRQEIWSAAGYSGSPIDIETPVDITDQINASKAGGYIKDGQFVEGSATYDPITKALTDPSKVIEFGGKKYNFTSYATDKKWGVNVTSILTSLPSFTSDQEVNQYIQLHAPGSQLKAEDISEVANEYEISPELLLSIAGQETHYMDPNQKRGGVGARSNNPGNVGNTDEVVAAGGSNSFATIKDGLRALAQNIKARDITGKTSEAGDNFDQFAKEQIALSVLPVQTRNSENELNRALDGIRKGLAQGLTPYQVADNLMGYKVEKPDAFTDSIRGYISQSDKLDAGAPGDFARLINSGNKEAVVSKLESAILKGTKVKEELEPLARYMGQFGDTAVSEINAMISKLGIVAGNWNKVAKKVVKSEDFQKLSSDLAALTAEWRKSMVGTAVTENELKFIDDLVASTKDNPFNAIAKIKSLQDMSLQKLNANRQTYNLPTLDKNSLYDMSARVKLYGGDNQATIKVGEGGKTSSGLSYTIE